MTIPSEAFTAESGFYAARRLLRSLRVAAAPLPSPHADEHEVAGVDNGNAVASFVRKTPILEARP